MLVDSDVVIWFLRGNRHAKEVFDRHSGLSLSGVTVMEILQGVRNRDEMRAWKQFLKARSIRILPVDEQITSKAIFWMEEFVLTHALRLGDALIAATADVYGLELLTGNASDYKYLPGLKIKSFRSYA